MLPGFPEAQPLHGLIGGMLIGLAAALMLLGAGRIAGVCGIVARAARIGSGDMAMTSAWGFLVGLPLGALAVAHMAELRPVEYSGSTMLVTAGLLVGFGTSMGSGCTSGHGVCGISRLSQRSIVATLTFMVAGFATVFIMSRIGG